MGKIFHKPMRDEREKSQVSNSARVYSDSLLLKSIDISDLHELGIYIKDLPITMEAVDIKEYFSTWGHVVSCKVVNTNRMRNVKTAIVTFRPSPASLDFMSLVHQPVYHGLKGRILNVDFTVKTSTHLGLLQSGEYTKPVFYSEVISLNMGMFMNRSKFLDVWRPSDKCTMEFNLDRKLIFLNLRHIDDNYRIGIRFDDVQNRVILDTSDENMYVLYFHIVRTPFLWRQQKSNAPLPDSWCEDDSWRRAPYIIDPSVESPVYDTGVRIGEFSAYRISVPVRNSSGEPFQEIINNMTLCGLFSNALSFINPIVTDLLKQSPVDIHSSLPFELAYLVECLISAQKLTLYNLSEEWITFMNSLDVAIAIRILTRMMQVKCTIEDPLTYSQQLLPELSNIAIDLEETSTQNMWIRRAQITPSKIYLLPPTLESSNRVLRQFCQYQQYFIRVTFSDEHFEKVGPNRHLYRAVFDDFKEILTTGFHLGKRHYRFLAFSSTQLREHGCWFFADTPEGVDVESIRSWMGDFSEIHNVAKHTACIGQAFSSTWAAKTLSKEKVIEIPDITRNGHIYSNGIGKISMSLATDIATHYHQKITPGAFQIRFGGHKGVLAVAPDDDMNGSLINLRPSQKKFNSDHCDLEIVKIAEFMPAYLNRQFITLLTTMMVSDDMFVHMQEDYLRMLDKIMTDQALALRFLALHYHSSWIGNTLREMIIAGFLRLGDNLTKSLLGLLRAQALRDVQQRARIPVSLGAQLIGVVDETNTLKENQIFVRYTDPQDPSIVRNYVGPALVTRNPYLHPGDIHMVQAVDCPKLHSLVNCIAFSTSGAESVPSQCGGGDLDGDIYMVIWDKRLFPFQNKRSLSRVKQEGPSKEKITTKDTVEFFINYMEVDNLGEIANAHLAWADQSDNSTLSAKCTKLTLLHAESVNFIKTGIPIKLDPSIFPKVWPDFMHKLPRKSYPSSRALGRMHRSDALEHQIWEYSFIDFSEEIHFNEIMMVPGYEEFLVEARQLKHEYDMMIKDVMNQYEIKTEAEVISGYIQDFPPMVNRRKERYILKETLSNVVQAIWRVFRERFNDGTSVAPAHKLDGTALSLKRKASAWYYVTCHPSEILLQKDRPVCSTDDKRIPSAKSIHQSFPWIVHDVLRQILKDVPELST